MIIIIKVIGIMIMILSFAFYIANYITYGKFLSSSKYKDADYFLSSKTWVLNTIDNEIISYIGSRAGEYISIHSFLGIIKIYHIINNGKQVQIFPFSKIHKKIDDIYMSLEQYKKPSKKIFDI